MQIRRDSTPGAPARDMALTREILQSVAAGCSPPTVRVYRPGSTVAFGKRDSHLEGFECAGRTAKAHGFVPVVRHAGGHAVAYDQESVVIDVLRPENQLLSGREERFVHLSHLIITSLERLGVTLELGELADEYCPGRFSLHMADGPKVAGIAQRVIKGASLTTAVVAVGSGERLRNVTAAVYADLRLPLDLRTVGSISDSHPGITASDVAHTVAELTASAS